MELDGSGVQAGVLGAVGMDGDALCGYPEADGDMSSEIAEYHGPAPSVFAGGSLGGGLGAVLGFLIGGAIGAAIGGALGALAGGFLGEWLSIHIGRVKCRNSNID